MIIKAYVFPFKEEIMEYLEEHQIDIEEWSNDCISSIEYRVSLEEIDNKTKNELNEILEKYGENVGKLFKYNYLIMYK